MWRWNNNTLKVSLQTNLLKLINITIPLDILSWMLLIRCDQVNLLSIGMPKCLLWKFFFYCSCIILMFSLMVTFLLFFQNSTRFIVCTGVSSPPSKTPLPSFLPSPPLSKLPPALPHLFRQSIIWFASAACPNLKLENPAFLGRKIKFRKLPTCGYKGI